MPDIHTIISSSHMEYKAGASTAQESEKLLKSKHPVPDSYQIPRNPSTSQSAPIDWGTAEEAAFKVGANTTGATSRQSPLIPPQNFAQVTPDIYRSGFPELENFEYLRTLGLRSVLMLVPEECPNDNLTFMRQLDIRLFQVRIPGNKDTANISADNVTTALSIILDRDNYPILIHCNKGKHRTGCVIACFRKLQHWPLSSILEEYHHHADPKARVADEEFIGQYDERPLSDIAWRQEVISSKPALHAKLVTKDGGIIPPLGPRVTAATSSGQ